MDVKEVQSPVFQTGQSIESYVGDVLDESPITNLHRRIFGLIASGYFFDIANLVIFGTLVPTMLATGFMTKAQISIVGSATLFGLAIGCAGQGEFTDRFGRKAVYQFNLLLFGVATVASAFAPNYEVLAVLRFVAGVGLGAEQPLCFAYAGEYAPRRNRGRMLALVVFIGGACSWPLSTLFSLTFIHIIGWRGIYGVLGGGALIVFLLRFSLPESPRWLATHGRGEAALMVLTRMGLHKPNPNLMLTSDAASHSTSDPIGIVFSRYPLRVIAGMVCFVAFFGVAIGLGTWLPNMMATSRGMSITKSLTYTLWIAMAYPCASGFMMYGIERFGRKRLSMACFVLAGVAAIAFANAPSNMLLVVAGFWMIFFVQCAGNSMQILVSEVFPTNARATGFGLASGTGRLGTAFIIPTILWIQNGFGVLAVFGAVAALVVVAASFVPLLGPEARGVALDELAPPTG